MTQAKLDWPGNDRIDRDRLRHTPKDECKIALILSHGTDPSEAQSAIDVSRALADAGYRVTGIPADGDALLRALLDGEGDTAETFPRSDYGIFFNGLLREAQDKVSAHWGAPERDPLFRESRLDCGAFAMQAVRHGNVIIAVQPSRGDIDLPPPHGYLAFYGWLADGIRASAIIHLGKPFDLENLLGTSAG